MPFEQKSALIDELKRFADLSGSFAALSNDPSMGVLGIPRALIV
jgi:hypothetical protein